MLLGATIIWPADLAGAEQKLVVVVAAAVVVAIAVPAVKFRWRLIESEWRLQWLLLLLLSGI